ncbi:hypothetical protein BGW36DRAFT_430143 [Talaromyces proteolyticus]|uniref:Uncharacterized protein n=1 Tax=Talaromyces proteolyticus TaxID=1131652 RepID=A0AAD4PYC3_9EURO|nr:uncharacterized protein BGW36DRAFT_430143 [Talaromyces proteolyticus]KAH8694119.1 hypothetical protein BGW36DRAFT_430143 [Talaromyces proteolyticus]
MSIRTKGSLAGWDQMLVLDLTLMNQIHNFWWPKEHGRKGIIWTYNNKNNDVQITGQQKEPGTFLRVDRINDSCFWYAVKLTSGTVQKGNQKVPIKEWHIQFPVNLENYQLPNSDYNDPEGLIHWGASIKFVRPRDSWDKRMPKFEAGQTQSPSESEVTQRLGLNSLNIAFWFWPTYDHSPENAGGLGVILRLVPSDKVSQERYHFGPTSFDLQLIYDNGGGLHIPAMVQNRKGPGTWPALDGDSLKENSGKLGISADLFWNQWFLKNYSYFVFDTQIWPVVPDSYRIGYNPNHPYVENKSFVDHYYEFIPNEMHHNGINESDKTVWTSGTSSADLPGGDRYISQRTWVDFGDIPEEGISLQGQINARLDDSGNWQVWYWGASFQVKEMRTNDGSVDVEIGQIGWLGFNNNSSPDWARRLYSTMGDTVTRTIKAKLGDLVGLKNAHQFWVPGYANFIAQDPKFLNTRDLVVDMFMNGVPK